LGFLLCGEFFFAGFQFRCSFFERFGFCCQIVLLGLNRCFFSRRLWRRWFWYFGRVGLLLSHRRLPHHLVARGLITLGISALAACFYRDRLAPRSANLYFATLRLFGIGNHIVSRRLVDACIF